VTEARKTTRISVRKKKPAAVRTAATVGDVSDVYNGPVGKVWELLMGEFIHVGGAEESRVMAEKARVGPNDHVLDVCSALGGPARFLARTRGCRVTGLDATLTMYQEALKRTAAAGLAEKVGFRLGNALDMPFADATFDVVWGEDAWCYVTDKSRLLAEVARVLKPGGRLAFTDWLQGPGAPADVLRRINTFMVFPYVETLEGYAKLCAKHGLTVESSEDLFPHFAEKLTGYITQAGGQVKSRIVDLVGEPAFGQMAGEMVFMCEAARRGEFGRGRIIAHK
jgi:ubiquinone/menaquinone biosynthesis C-methylase UbiE